MERCELEMVMCETLRQAVEESGLSQGAVGAALGKRLNEPAWGQSRVWKLLWCQMPVTVRVWQAAAQVVGLRFDELCGPREAVGMVVSSKERALLMHFRRQRNIDAVLEAFKVRPTLTVDEVPAEGQQSQSA